MSLSTKLLPPGFVIRAPREEDAQAVADLMRACDIANYGVPDSDVNDVLDEWSAPDFELQRDAWILERPGAGIVGYAGTRARRAGADFDASLCVLPGESVPALGPSLIEAVETRVLEAAPAGEALVCCFIASVETAWRALLEQSGYKEARTFFRMRIDLAPGPARLTATAPAWDEPAVGEIEIRALRLGIDDRTLHATLEESFAEHFRHSPRTFEDWWALRANHARFDPDLCLVAWEDERAAGALFAYDYEDLGFIRELGVLKPWRGRGVGSALLRRSFEDFRTRGQFRVVLGVDAENEGAVVLYERVGMRVEQRHLLMQKRLGG
jgi:mycothiol synthase